MKMATSITEISRMGRVTLFATKKMIRKTSAMEMAFTTVKSWPVVSIRSFMQGASPISMPPLSYFFRMPFSAVICSFTSSLAALYSETTSRSFQRSLSRI